MVAKLAAIGEQVRNIRRISTIVICPITEPAKIFYTQIKGRNYLRGAWEFEINTKNIFLRSQFYNRWIVIPRQKIS